MNKSESKYFNTAKKIDEAFLLLLEKKDFAYITVKEICENAGVNRSTFYLHYETINDLLIETVEYINGRFQAYFEHIDIDLSDITSVSLETLDFIKPEFLTPWLSFIKENKRLYQTVLDRYDTLKMGDNYQQILKSIIFPILERYGIPDDNKRYVLLFYMEGLNGIVKEWLRDDCKKEISEVEKIVLGCVDGR